MARNCDGSTKYLTHSAAVVTAAPFTLSCWFYPGNVTAQHGLLGIGDTGVGNGDRWQLTAEGASVGDPLSFTARVGSGASASTANAFSANVWGHAVGIEVSTTSRIAVLNGDWANRGTNTTSKSPGGLDVTRLGARAAGTATDFLLGYIAEGAIWNAELNQSEVEALSRGVSPRLVRSGSLVAYWPCWGLHDPELDLTANNRTLTLTGGPIQASHAPVVPFSKQYWKGWVAESVIADAKTIRRPAWRLAPFEPSVDYTW